MPHYGNSRHHLCDGKMKCRFCENSASVAEVVLFGKVTGVDEAGIKAAQDCGIKCSILASKGFRMHYEEVVELEGKEQFVKRFLL